jgi:ubiquinone biosynthesis monooxygenase Coq7
VIDKTIIRILRVNHAGEYGAIRIYGAQIFCARFLHRDLLPFLEETRAHEIDHCRRFAEALTERQSRTCAAMPLWGCGGWMLGFVTACLGRNAVMACTAAVERTVHAHLEEQIRYLGPRDPALRDMIAEIQQEELTHLAYAEDHLRQSWLVRPLTGLIALATEVVIYLSTQGDLGRMRREIAADHTSSTL